MIEVIKTAGKVMELYQLYELYELYELYVTCRPGNYLIQLPLSGLFCLFLTGLLHYHSVWWPLA